MSKLANLSKEIAATLYIVATILLLVYYFTLSEGIAIFGLFLFTLSLVASIIIIIQLLINASRDKTLIKVTINSIILILLGIILGAFYIVVAYWIFVDSIIE